MFHKEGKTIILGTTAIVVAVLLLADKFISIDWLKIFIFIIALAFLIIILQFFRNPKRNTVANTNDIIAPADGKVVVIEEVDEPEYFKQKCKQISIFMSPFNVHVNRNPISGNVEYVKYHPGKYLVAWHPKSSTENERSTVVIKNKHGEVLFRQIAGALAKRIVYYVNQGDQVQQGGEMGFIKFGSRIDIYLPLNADIKVNLNDKTRGGETIIASLV